MSVTSATQSLKTRRLDEEDSLVLSADVQEKTEIDLISGKGFEQIAALFSTSSVTPFPKPIQKNFIPSVDNPFSKSASAFKAPDFSLTVPFDQLQLPEKKPTPPSAISTYVGAALTGGTQGVKDLWNIACHPVDNLVKPVYQFSFDSVAIAAKHSDAPALSKMKEEIKKNPEIYSDSMNRMHLRVNNLVAAVDDFISGDKAHKIEKATELATVSIGGLGLVKAVKKTPQAIRTTVIKTNQLVHGVKLPVINNITFDPRTFVRYELEGLRQGIADYSYVKGDKKSILVHVEWISNVMENQLQTKSSGVFYETRALIHQIAKQEGAKRIFVQFLPWNKDLFQILKNRYPYQGRGHYYLPNTQIGYLEKWKNVRFPIIEITNPTVTANIPPSLWGFGVGLSQAVVKAGKSAVSGTQKAIEKGKQVLHEVDNAPPKPPVPQIKVRGYLSDLAPSRDIMHEVVKGPREKKTMTELLDQLNNTKK